MKKCNPLHVAYVIELKYICINNSPHTFSNADHPFLCSVFIYPSFILISIFRLWYSRLCAERGR